MIDIESIKEKYGYVYEESIDRIEMGCFGYESYITLYIRLSVEKSDKLFIKQIIFYNVDGFRLNKPCRIFLSNGFEIQKVDRRFESINYYINDNAYDEPVEKCIEFYCEDFQVLDISEIQ